MKMEPSKVALEKPEVASDDRAAERRRRQEAEKWARALAQTVAGACPPSATPVPSAAPPEVWRSGDGALTQRTAGDGAAKAPSPEAAESESRVRVSLSAGDLGEVDIVVDRSPVGLRILIGLTDPEANLAVAPELSALQRAIEANGIRVASLRAVARSRLGTVLAESNSRSAAGEEPVDETSRESKRRHHKRLNLIG